MVFHTGVNLMPWELEVPPLRFPSIALRAYGNGTNSLLYDYFRREYNGVNLTVPMKGGYPRAELRQLNAIGTDKEFWHCKGRVHHLKTKLVFRYIPEGTCVVIGQIDEEDSIIPPVTLQYTRLKDKGHCVVIYRESPIKLPLFAHLSKDMKLSESFIYTINVDALGEVSVTVNDNSFSFHLDQEWNTYKLFFKVGLHVQNDPAFDGVLETEILSAKFKTIALL